MQPPPQPLTTPQLPPPMGRGALVWGCGSQPMLRVGERWVSQGDLIRHRFAACQEIVARTSEGLNKVYPSFGGKSRSLRSVPGEGPFTVGSTGTARLPMLPPTYGSGHTHHPNPVSQTPVPANHIRPQAPPSSHPHNPSGPPPSVPQPHHTLNHHPTTPSGLVQHHHTPIPGPGVSAPTGLNTVPQATPVATVLPPGPSQANQGHHDINVQPIPNPSGQLAQGSVPSVPLPAGVMYPPSSQTHQPQGPPQNSQAPPYYQPMHPGSQQRQIPAMQPNYSYVIHPSPNYPIIQSHLPIGQPRHAPSNGQHPYPQIPHAPYYPHPMLYFQAQQQAQQVKPPVNHPAREKRIIQIKDPNSGKEIDLTSLNDESKSEKGPSPQQSRESSARNTPAPRDAPTNAVAAEFAQKVASAAASDKADGAPSEVVENNNERTIEHNETCSHTLEISESSDKNLNIDNKVEFVSQSQIIDSTSCVPEYINPTNLQPPMPPTVQQQQTAPPQDNFVRPQPSPPVNLLAHQKVPPPCMHPQMKQPSPTPQEKVSPQPSPSPPPNGAMPRQAAPLPAVNAPQLSLKNPNLPKHISKQQSPPPPQPLPSAQQMQQIPPHSQQKVANTMVPNPIQVRPQPVPNQKQQPKQASPPPEQKQQHFQSPTNLQASTQQTPPAVNPSVSKQQQQHCAPKQPPLQPQPQHSIPKQHQTPQSKMQQQQPPPPQPATGKIAQQAFQPKQQQQQTSTPPKQPLPPLQNQPSPQSKQAQGPNTPKASPPQKQIPPNANQSQGKPAPVSMTAPQHRAPKQKPNSQANYTQSSQGTQQGKPTSSNQPSGKGPQASQQSLKSTSPGVKGSSSQPKAPANAPSKGTLTVNATSDNDGAPQEPKTKQDVNKSFASEKVDVQKAPSMQTVTDSHMEKQGTPVVGVSSVAFENGSLPQTLGNHQQPVVKTAPAEVNPDEMPASGSSSVRTLDSRESSEDSVRSSSFSSDNRPPTKGFDSSQNGILGNPPLSGQRAPVAEEALAAARSSPAGLDKDISKAEVVKNRSTSKSSSASPVPPVKRESPELSAVEGKINDEIDSFQDKPKETPASMKPESVNMQSANKGAVPTQEKQKEKLKYDRSFLLEFQKAPLALKRPESLPNLEVVLDGPVSRSHERPPKMNHDFTPTFLQNNRGGRGPMQFIPPKSFGGRNSQSGKRPPKIIEFQTTSEANLRTTEHAWKPTSKLKDTPNDEKAKSDKIVKKVRGVLNKLTPDNFDKLVGRVQEISFDNFSQFDEVITLVFEKAVSEQSFSSMYAELCKVLSAMSVTSNASASEHGKEKADAKFKNLIISKCQQEFERENSDNTELAKLAEELNQCTDPEKKAELKANYDFEETKLRKKSVGNVRFIGELYKLKMLTSPIMMRIIGSLLNKKDEESLECLCKLLQTIGKSLDASAQNSSKAQEDLNKHFKTMQDLVNSRSTSSRVRFLMMNVIDMKKNDWIPRREDAKPKTKAQVHEDIKKEEFEAAQILNTSSRRDDRERKRSRDNRMMDTRGINDDWTMVTNNQRRGFDSSRMAAAISGNRVQSQDGLLLRPNINMWGSGSSGGMKDSGDTRDNRFMILQESGYSEPRRSNVGPRLAPGGNMGGTPGFNRHGYGSKSMPAPSEKPNQFNRGMLSSEHSKSSSRSSSRDSSLARETKTPPIITPTAPQMSFAEARKRTVPIIEEYMGIKDRKEAKSCVEETFTSSSMHLFVQASSEWVLDKDPEKRKLMGQLLHYLLTCSLLSPPHIVTGLKSVTECIEDFALDMPKVNLYVGEILAPLLVDSALTLQKMEEIFEPAGDKKAELMANLVKVASLLMGTNKVSELWKESGLKWTRLIPEGTPIEDFIAKHNLEFLRISNIEEVQETLYQMFKNEVSIDVIFSWINQKVNDVTDKKFIRALVTALVESQAKTSADGSTITWGDNFENKLKDKLKAVHKYVDNLELREIQCLYALQAISVKYQHPPGLLEKCFNTFYDCEIVCEETFFEWFKSTDPEEQVGKGVCVASVHKFLKWLEESETEEAEPAP